MIRSSLPPWERARGRHAAFTLIELLTVISIILVLAGLLLHIAGGANTKASLARAQAEISAMSAALESYKADNGAYPRPTTPGSASDKLNAQSATDADPGGGDKSVYQASGQLLFEALSGTPVTGTTYGKRYMEFKPGQLSTNTAAADATTYVIDPFGICYGYSTAAIYQTEQVQAGNTTASAASTYGYNPTFDLWSSGGYGTGGKMYPSGVTASAVWVKNW